MRLTAALAGLALAAPALAAKEQQSVFKSGQLGFSLGAVLPDPDGAAVNKTMQDYMDDLQAIKSNTQARTVRLYAASQNGQTAVLPAAKKLGFQVVLGVWVATASDTASFDADVAAIAEVADEYKDTIYGVTIGSEGLYRGNYTATELSSMIKEFRSKVPAIDRVGTADTWNALSDGRGDAIIQSKDVNLILANAFAFWQNSGTWTTNASYCYHDDVQQSLSHVQELRGSLDAIEYWTGETGWPTAGGGYGDKSTINNPDVSKRHYSEASESNALDFMVNGTCAALAYGINVFVFEAFDEPLKPDSIGLNGEPFNETNWGVMDVNRKPKFKLTCD